MSATTTNTIPGREDMADTDDSGRQPTAMLGLALGVMLSVPLWAVLAEIVHLVIR